MLSTRIAAASHRGLSASLTAAGGALSRVGCSAAWPGVASGVGKRGMAGASALDDLLSANRYGGEGKAQASLSQVTIHALNSMRFPLNARRSVEGGSGFWFRGFRVHRSGCRVQGFQSSWSMV